MNNKSMILACAVALGAALMQPNPAAAQAANTNTRTKLAGSIAEIRAETIKTRDQLQATVNSLNALVKQTKGDLQPTFHAFAEEVKKTHDAADLTTTRIAGMQNASKEYFGAWQQEVAAISNESLRKQGQKRMDKVQKTYDGVVASLQQASERFKPFLSNLDDMQKMLANDVTPGGVKAIRGTVSEANWNMKKVRSSVLDAVDELGSMEKSLSSQVAD